MISIFYCALAFFVLPHVRHHKMSTFRNYLRGVKSKFQNNRCEEVEALRFVPPLRSFLNNFAVVKVNEAVGERPQRYVVRNE